MKVRLCTSRIKHNESTSKESDYFRRQKYEVSISFFSSSKSQINLIFLYFLEVKFGFKSSRLTSRNKDRVPGIFSTQEELSLPALSLFTETATGQQAHSSSHDLFNEAWFQSAKDDATEHVTDPGQA